MKHTCPECDAETVYQPFSGGREWYCENCQSNGPYPDGQAPRRAGLLQSEAGRVALRAEMDQELAKRRNEE